MVWQSVPSNSLQQTKLRIVRQGPLFLSGILTVIYPLPPVFFQRLKCLLFYQYSTRQIGYYISVHIWYFISLSVYLFIIYCLQCWVGAWVCSMRDTWCRAVYWGNLCLSYRFPILTQQFTATWATCGEGASLSSLKSFRKQPGRCDS